MSDLLVGFSFQFNNENKNYSLVLDIEDLKSGKESGADYLQQVFHKLIENHPELEESIENYFKTEQ